MKGVLLEVDEALLERRRRTGADRRDELWNGVLHMPPPPGDPHQDLGQALFRVLAPLAERRGLRPRYETGLFRTADDYRVPDQVYARPDHFSTRGVEGTADVIVEVRSPHDETYEKLDWYAAQGIREVLVVHPGDRRIELYVLRAGRMMLVQPDAAGEVASDVLGARFSTVAGPRLRVTSDDGVADV